MITCCKHALDLRSPFHSAFLFCLGLLVGVNCTWSATNALPVIAPEPSKLSILQPPSAGGGKGAQLAQVTCSVCHLVPEPSLLTQEIWKTFVLEKMAYYCGIQQLDPERNEEADLMVASGLFRSTPMVTREQWQEITNFYLESSPKDSIPHGPRPDIPIGLKQFAVQKPRFRRDPPGNTLVAIDPDRRVVFSADANQQGIDVLSADGDLLSSLPVGNIPVWMDQTDRGVYLACIGHFFAREERRGQLILMEHTPTGLQRKVLLSGLARPCHVRVTDLNGDQEPDVLLSMFGYLTGRLSWYEAKGDDDYREHILYPRAGAICCAVEDFNEDGIPDIAALFGQEVESLLIYCGDGKGGFLPPHRVFQTPPSYGHTYFETADFNGDGKLDLLVCNGDNGDYISPPKPYHGIRIYLNQGGLEFKEALFLPQHGVYRALARDFDEDGDLDIASVAFYPDYEKNPRESFIYWENTDGKLSYSPSTFRECISGRWLTVDAGDLDGDGDLDLALGSLIEMPDETPAFLKEMWKKSGPSVLILKNTLR